MASFLAVTAKCSKFIFYNHKNLEFLYLWGMMAFPRAHVKMVKVKTVVLKSDDKYGYTEEDEAVMKVLCPNAVVMNWKYSWDDEYKDEMEEFVISMNRARGFTADIKNFL